MQSAITETQFRYALMPTAGGVRPLKVRLFRPDRATAPHPLMIWLHSGGFRTGTINHPAHGAIGRQMAERHGYATAFIEYRLRTPPEKVSVQSSDLLADLADETQCFDFGINPFFTGSAAIAAMEDCIVFFTWLDRFRERHGLGRHIIMGGSSAGAITVLNTLFLSPHLGIRLPHVSSAFIYSGAFAYPTFYNQNRTRILAVHSEHDPKIPIASIRHFAMDAAAQCKLLESPRHIHGDLRLTPDETRDAAIARIVQFDHQGTLSLPAALAVDS